MDADPSSSGTLLEQVLDRLGDDSNLVAFARSYLRRIPFGAGMEPDSAAAEVLSLFEFIRHPGDRIDVRVFNPTVDTVGYTTPGTVVEIRSMDVPFLVDSVRAEIHAHQLEVARVLHPVIGVERDAVGTLREVVRASEATDRESIQHYVLDRTLDEVDHPHLESRLRMVLADVLVAVRDFDELVEATNGMIEAVRRGDGAYPGSDIDEAVAFLEWLRQDNFVFLGYREYRVVETDEGRGLETVPETGLGILSDPQTSKTRRPVPFSDLPDEVVARYREGGLLVISKTNSLSTVHRRARMDYVGVRVIGEAGETVGEFRLIGLFTSKAYMESVARVPVLRRKLEDVASSEDLIAGSHDHKAVVALVESFPKDELFGLPSEDLRRVVLGLLALQERARVRLFVRRDLLDRGVRILIAMPRDRYSASLRRRLQALLIERFGGTDADYHLNLGRSDIARLHFTVWVPEGHVPEVAFEELDSEVMELTRSWGERVAEVLAERHDRPTARQMVERWDPGLPDYYKTSTDVRIAAGDIEQLEALSVGEGKARVALQNEWEEPHPLTRITLYETGGKSPLSQLTPALEDLGLTVVEEVPTRVDGMTEVFMHDFGVLGASGQRLDVDRSALRVARTLEAIWEGRGESDSLNRLVLDADLDHEQVALLRAYQTYWRRVSPTFTVRYVNDALVANPDIAAGLVHLFEIRFDPSRDGEGYAKEREELLERLDAVPSLDEDRILAGFLRLIDATLRTNAYVPDRVALSLKLRSADVPDMPAPEPFVETFVIGRDVEGIHLRAGSRARGGIRWSERREDYRTEVLGLMKAQVTKNSIIVPSGAKGGFVLRHVAGSSATPDDVATAYATYIRGLFDLTDDLVDSRVTAPAGVRALDGPDPYLVVAADRGTAGLSDLANRISAEYGFWLDDAFASGGASGYDHKEIGITARGAWKSLERHFLELGIDPVSDDFTAVGIGDMSGDVFGNGMLQSRSMKLVAAFDHRHIFIDPDPDPEAAFEERRRLYELSRSSWDDYDRSLLSPGGGVYPRAAKRVELSQEARQVLGTEAKDVTPSELIHLVLCAPVDLVWNGGIGTYVKASTESHDDVGDRTNDAVRVDARDLRARVVVEGGNLGFTQRGRIQYAEGGGLINADFIDNSAGVHCSDREVNLKILLGLAERRGDLTRAERDTLLQAAVDDVVAAILADNLAQAHRLALDEAESVERIDAYSSLLDRLEESGFADRRVDVLPTRKELAERARAGRGLSRPELAVLLAHAKRSLSQAIEASDLPDDEALRADLERYFPTVVVERFGSILWDHPLRRELLSTIVANDVVNNQGPTFVGRLVRRRGVDPATVVSAFRAARAMVGREAREKIEDLFGSVEAAVWREMVEAETRLVAVITRWMLANPDRWAGSTDLSRAAGAFCELEEQAAEWGSVQKRAERTAVRARLEAAGVPPPLARRAAAAGDLVHAPDMLEVAAQTGRSLGDVGSVFHRIGRVMELDSLVSIARGLKVTDTWQRWALQTVEDDLLSARRGLAEQVLIGAGAESVEEAIDHFLTDHDEEVRRVTGLVRSLAREALADPAPLVVAMRQIQTIARA